MADGILVSQPEMENMSPSLEGGFPTTGPPGKFLKIKSPQFCFYVFLKLICLFILVARGFRYCAWVSSSCSKQASLLLRGSLESVLKLTIFMRIWFFTITFLNVL